MTQFHWCSPIASCRACGDEIEAGDCADCLCEKCIRRCASWVRRQPQFQPNETAPSGGPGWDVDHLPDDDPRVVAYIQEIELHMEWRNRLSDGRFTDQEIAAWLAWVLCDPKQRKWLVVTRSPQPQPLSLR